MNISERIKVWIGDDWQFALFIFLCVMAIFAGIILGAAIQQKEYRESPCYNWTNRPLDQVPARCVNEFIKESK